MLIVILRFCEVNHTMFSTHSLSCSLLEIVTLPKLKQERPFSTFLLFCFTSRFSFTSTFVSMKRLGSAQKLLRHTPKLEFLTILNKVE